MKNTIYLQAIVKDKYTKNSRYIIIKSNDYSTKKDFKKDLKSNGYIIRSILNKRDLVSLDLNYKNFADMRKSYSLIWKDNPTLYKYEINEYMKIKNIQL